MNFKENYNLQDKVLSALSGKASGFYLTGGTALSRFYLHHRYSEDLDLFTNQNPTFADDVLKIREWLSAVAHISEDRWIQYESFSRFWITNGVELKIELVNDVHVRWGDPLEFRGVFIDTVANILTNKLTALFSRDEPKDIFDIISISENYSFNWEEVFSQALKKAVLNEPELSIRFKTFPVEIMDGLLWLKKPININEFKEKLDQIAHDFILAKENSLGVGRQSLTDAEIRISD